MGHQTLSMVRRLPEANGRNSKKSAPSTGRFPPTPRPKQENRAQALIYSSAIIHHYKQEERTYPIQLGLPPAARPNTLVMRRVRLKAGRRPITSDATPQNEAPRQRPKNNAQVVKRTRLSETPNSADI